MKDKDEICDDYVNKGMNQVEIAEKHNCTRQYVSLVLKGKGYSRKNGAIAERTRQKLLAELKKLDV